ncbi:MAG TPA: GntR family transcriptional regulator [Candidatus Limnocylindrales bacterium]
MRRSAPISRSTLSDQVKEYLLQAIMAGEFAPGSRIVETRVARDLGISQGPVREALRDLEALGVIESTAFQGARVRHPSKAELLEAYGIRAELESLGARLALPRVTDADLEELQDLVSEMLRAATLGDTRAEARIDATFHTRVIEIAGNTTLQRVWRYLEPVSRTYITFVTPGIDARRIADVHGPIVEALRRRDPEQAVEAVHRHFQVAGAQFVAGFRDDPEAAPGAALAAPAELAAG